MADELFDARNALTIGNYDQAIADASNARPMQRKPEDTALFSAEKDTLLYRAQIGLGEYNMVRQQLRTATNPSLKAVLAFAEFKAAFKETPCTDPSALSPGVQAALVSLQESVGSLAAANPYSVLLTCCALLHVHDNAGVITLGREWLKVAPEPKGSHAIRQHTEVRSLIVEALLRINRADHARSELASMEKIDEEGIATLLSSGMVALFEGQSNINTDKFQSALSSFKDVSMRCGNSVMILNLTALAHMGLSQFEEAERCLLDALAMRSADPDTIANLATVALQLGRSSDAAERYMLQASGMNGSYSRSFEAVQSAFDAAAAEFEPATIVS